MPSSITITQLTPSIAHFNVVLSGGGAVDFKKSGAVGINKDLTSLGPGPLKEYLTRLADWSSVAAPASGAKVRWRLITSSDSDAAPVAGVQAIRDRVAANGATSVQFRSGVVGVTGSMTLELAFIHSRYR
jgi:hypothetical protein